MTSLVTEKVHTVTVSGSPPAGDADSDLWTIAWDLTVQTGRDFFSICNRNFVVCTTIFSLIASWSLLLLSFLLWTESKLNHERSSLVRKSRRLADSILDIYWKEPIHNSTTPTLYLSGSACPVDPLNRISWTGLENNYVFN